MCALALIPVPERHWAARHLYPKALLRLPSMHSRILPARDLDSCLLASLPSSLHVYEAASDAWKRTQHHLLCFVPLLHWPCMRRRDLDLRGHRILCLFLRGISQKDMSQPETLRAHVQRARDLADRNRDSIRSPMHGCVDIDNRSLWANVCQCPGLGQAATASA
jgi:hypothetical protein